jgi:hypothetical protein
MLVGINNSIEVAKVFAQHLLAEVGARVDDNVKVVVLYKYR